MRLNIYDRYTRPAINWTCDSIATQPHCLSTDWDFCEVFVSFCIGYVLLSYQRLDFCRFLGSGAFSTRRHGKNAGSFCNTPKSDWQSSLGNHRMIVLVFRLRYKDHLLTIYFWVHKSSHSYFCTFNIRSLPDSYRSRIPDRRLCQRGEIRHWEFPSLDWLCSRRCPRFSGLQK